MQHTLVFIHGLEGSSLGTKAQYLRKHFPEMIIEDYTGDFPARMAKLTRLLEGKTNLILVGSSFGGLMAAKFVLDHEERVRKVILIAPALILEEFEKAVSNPIRVPTIIYHGVNDDVVDPAATQAIAEKTFINLTHHLVEDDHSLNRVFPTLNWPVLLELAH